MSKKVKCTLTSVPGHSAGACTMSGSMVAFFSSPAEKVCTAQGQVTNRWDALPASTGMEGHLFWILQAGLGSRDRTHSSAQPAHTQSWGPWRGEGRGAWRVFPAATAPLPLPTIGIPFTRDAVLVSAADAESPTSGTVHSMIRESRYLSCQDHLSILIRGKIKNGHGFWK